MTTILVTGGAGYIGSHTCKYLASKGYSPVVFDNLSRGNSWAVKWGPFEEGDLLDQRQINAVLKKYKPSAVIHFAAYAYVGESVSDPLTYYVNNVAGTLNLLRAMVDHNLDKIVFSSTCSVYGVPTTVPIPEEQETNPINPYGRTKLIVENMLSNFHLAYELNSVSLRYFNAAGADIDLEIGEVHDPEPHLIPSVLQVATGVRKSVEVFGTDYPTPDGTCIRDYIHVTDLASAHVKALQLMESESTRRVYNLGNERGFSVLEIVDACRKITGHPIPVDFCDRRAGDPPTLIGDAVKAKTELGWVTKFSDLETIVETAFQWQLKCSHGST